MPSAISLTYPSKEFGQTPPPSDGGIVACPTCVKGQRLTGLAQLIGCPDCLGSGVRGYGFTALLIFEKWLDGLPSDDGSDGDLVSGAPG
jgi:hypothetical protein